jgi:transposase
MDDKAEKTALFRYGLIAPLVLETLPRGELTRRAQEIAARLYDIPCSIRRQVSVDTLLEWTPRYRRNGLAALTPQPRQDRGQMRAITAETAALIERLKRESPSRTGAALLHHLALEKQFLTSLDPKALLSLEQLNERFGHWIETVYHRREHSALQTTPLLRWQRDIEQVRQLPPATDLRRLFFHRVDRLVRRDSTFLLHGQFFEAPPQLAGQRIEVRFDPLDPAQVEIYHGGQLAGAARLVDAVVNGRTYR